MKSLATPPEEPAETAAVVGGDFPSPATPGDFGLLPHAATNNVSVATATMAAV